MTRDGDFIGVAARNSAACREAIEKLSKTATWDHTPQVSSPELFEHLRKTAKDPNALKSPHAAIDGTKLLRSETRVAYVQHVPLEPRAAVAEWDGDKLTVWTATQNPHGVRGELARSLGVSPDNVRVIVPDFGGGFGGKHTGECAVEAARLARAANKPVRRTWTREEEFQWASFRPAALIVSEAALAADGSIASWHFVNVNSGGAGLKSPYRAALRNERFVESTAPPLRHGSYRALAATANHFARETFVDELAEAAGSDPLSFRLANLDESRLAKVLKTAADNFGWAKAFAEKRPTVGVGLACGNEKGSFVATCAEVAVDDDAIKVKRLRVAYDCGKILNPAGLLAQVQGAVVQGLGPALYEQIELADGRVTNGDLERYRVPRFSDVPTIDVDLLDQPELPSAGAGETPIVTVAPAIANAVFHATGKRAREMPIRL